MADEWFHLRTFIREMRGRSPLGIDEALTRDMDLHHDLDWKPKRIVEIMHIWAQRFNVDIRDFDIAYYIPSVTMGTGQFLWTTLKSPSSASAREALGGRLLTLDMMEAATPRPLVARIARAEQKKRPVALDRPATYFVCPHASRILRCGKYRMRTTLSFRMRNFGLRTIFRIRFLSRHRLPKQFHPLLQHLADHLHAPAEPGYGKPLIRNRMV